MSSINEIVNIINFRKLKEEIKKDIQKDKTETDKLNTILKYVNLGKRKAKETNQKIYVFEHEIAWMTKSIQQIKNDYMMNSLTEENETIDCIVMIHKYAYRLEICRTKISDNLFD